MKRFLFVFICCALSSFRASAQEFSGTTGACKWAFIQNTGTLKITGNGSMDDYSEPFPAPWQRFKYYIRKIDIEFSGVKKIGNYAFSDLLYVNEEIVIPNSCTTIGDYAFSGCSNLTSITIPESVSSIGENAFSGCLRLRKINIPKVITNIGKQTFLDCTSLESIIIPEGVKTIGEEAFANDSTLKTIVFPNSLMSVDKYAFDNCKSLKSINLPKTMTSIGNFAFRNCSSLTIIKLPNCLKYLGSCAFRGCDSLTSITIPNGIEFFGDNVFYDVFNKGCHNLSSITSFMLKPFELTEAKYLGIPYGCVLYIPEGTKQDYIDKGWNEKVFQGGIIEKHLYITFEDENVSNICIDNWDIDRNKFIDISELSDITSLRGIFRGNKNIESFKELEYFTGLDTIHKYVFDGCSNLKTIYIPSKINNIEQMAFRNCNNLEKVIIPEIANWCKTKLYDDLSNPLSYAHHLYSDERTEITNLVIPDGTDSINSYSFFGCSSLKSVRVPESVCYLGGSAFAYCSNLSSITLPDNIENIESMTFRYCTSLKTLKLPESIKTIFHWAFEGCSSLESIIIPNNVTTICQEAFSKCTNLKSVTLSDNLKELKWSVFDGCTNLETINLPSSLETIGNGCFWHCSSLKAIEIPENVKTIENNAFKDCSSLSVVKSFSKDPIEFGNNAFSGIGAKCVLYVPKGTKNNYIGKGWTTSIFRGGIKEFDVPTDIKQIDSYLMEDNHIYTLNGQRVIIPDNQGIYIVNGKKIYIQ